MVTATECGNTPQLAKLQRHRELLEGDEHQLVQMPPPTQGGVQAGVDLRETLNCARALEGLLMSKPSWSQRARPLLARMSGFGLESAGLKNGYQVACPRSLSGYGI